ncbi:TrpS Tryptophanyl-tRNA synthetase [Candidatus Pelagibacterales bacterium]
MIKNRILSGVQPTGNLHLGNYLGAIKNFVKLQKNYECYFMLADLHSITVFQDPKQLRENIIETAAVFLACGLDPKKNVIFCQSSVAGHSELAWIFNCVARIGWLNRMTQFKEKAGSNKEKASVGLYSYPTLMAADILLYRATHVPVGEDQKQHLELCRDIALKFNNDFNCKDFFTLPEPIITKEVARIMSLKDGTKKMSKSDESEASRINLTDSEEDIIQKIKKAKTDNDLIPDAESKLVDRPEARNLINIFSILNGSTIEKTLKELSGKNFSELKNKLSDILIKEILPIGKKIKEFKKDTETIKKILKIASEKANIESQKTIKEVHKIVGLSLS